MADGQRLAWLHAHGEVLGEQPIEGENALRVSVRMSPADLGRFTRL
jgi:GTP-binding protein HflX